MSNPKPAYDGPPTIEIVRLAMYTPAPDTPGKNSKLAWCVRDGHPRLTTFTNVADDKVQGGAINAPMDVRTFEALMMRLEAIAKGPNGKRDKITCDTNRKTDKGMEKIHLSDVVFGKDDNGIVWIIIVAEGRPKVKFEFTMSRFHEIIADGQPLSASEASVMATLGHLRAAQAIYPAYYTQVQAPAPRDGGRQGGGYNKPAPSSFGDDIDF